MSTPPAAGPTATPIVAAPAQTGVLLTWTTASEIDNFGFEIQRRRISPVASPWGRAGFIEGNGTTLAPHDYHFTDDVTVAGSYAYRLRQMDLDGTAHVLVCTGLLSRCIQHEADHLNGVLFIDQMAKRVAVELKDDLKALEKDTKAAAKKQPK